MLLHLWCYIIVDTTGQLNSQTTREQPSGRDIGLQLELLTVVTSVL